MGNHVTWLRHRGGAQLHTPDDERVEVIGPPSLSVASLITGIARLAAYKDLVYTLTLARIKMRYKQSVLGWIWAFAQPLALMVAYTAISSVFARIPSGNAPYPVFALAALLPWTLFSSSVTNATGGLIHYGYLLTRVYFPREIIPFTYILVALFDFVLTFFALAGMLVYYHVRVTISVLYIFPIIVCLTAYSAGIALLLSAIQVHFRDVGVAVPVILQVWMLASPVVYPYGSVPVGLRPLYLLNPLVGIVENFRRAVIPGVAFDWNLFAVSAVISIASFIVCYVIFKYLDSTFADVI